MTLEEKIAGIHTIPHTSKLKKLNNNSATTIAEFWEKVVEPMLPDYATMEKWHNLLVEYVSIPEAVFMLRRAHDEAPAYQETVPADALRRGFLTKTDQGYWFVYNDNAFATYLLAMVLDGDVIDTLKAKDLLAYLQTPNSTIRFHRSGKGGVEKKKAYFKISGSQPQISPYGYTVAHIFDVNDHYYDENLGFNNTRGDQALRSSNIQIDRGMYSDYTLQGTVAGKEIYYRDNYHVGTDARKFLEAHMLRFLHPLNYFCAPKDNMNGYTYCEFTDHVHTEHGKSTKRRFHRISGYEHLLYYAHHKFKEKYGDLYDDFLKRIMLPKNTFDFFEKTVAKADSYGTEIIDVKYGNPLSGGGGTVTVSTKSTKTKSVKKSKYSKDQAVEIAAYYLKNNTTCEKLDKLFFGIENGHGVTTWTLLKKLGVDTSRKSKHKGMLIHTGIDDAIVNATDPIFKNTLEEIKKRGL